MAARTGSPNQRPIELIDGKELLKYDQRIPNSVSVLQ